MTAATPIIEENIGQALKESPSALAAFEAVRSWRLRAYPARFGETPAANPFTRRIGAMIERLEKPATDVQA